jgi:hypothetical protein
MTRSSEFVGWEEVISVSVRVAWSVDHVVKGERAPARVDALTRHASRGQEGGRRPVVRVRVEWVGKKDAVSVAPDNLFVYGQHDVSAAVGEPQRVVRAAVQASAV